MLPIRRILHGESIFKRSRIKLILRQTLNKVNLCVFVAEYTFNHIFGEDVVLVGFSTLKTVYAEAVVVVLDKGVAVEGRQPCFVPCVYLEEREETSVEDVVLYLVVEVLVTAACPCLDVTGQIAVGTCGPEAVARKAEDVVLDEVVLSVSCTAVLGGAEPVLDVVYALFNDVV